MCDPSLPDVPLPSGWASNAKSAVLHVISLAQYAMVTVRGWAANSLNARVRLTADNNQLKQENQWLCEELRIKNARLAKIDPATLQVSSRAACRPIRSMIRSLRGCRRRGRPNGIARRPAKALHDPPDRCSAGCSPTHRGEPPGRRVGRHPHTR